MPRERHQSGWVELVGKRVKKWEGYYYVYVTVDGVEKRRRRSVVLGQKSKMRKWEAEQKLAQVIAESLNPVVEPPADTPPPAVTLGWFWINRFQPLKRWKSSRSRRIEGNIERYVVRPFFYKPLAEMKYFDVQQELNRLADAGYSASVCKCYRTYMKAILDAAVEDDVIVKNPARKLELPSFTKAVKRTLTVEEIAALLAEMDGRERLIVRIALVLGLRPGEIFALRRNDVGGQSLRVDESASLDAGVVAVKTDASEASVWVPPSLAAEIQFWLSVMPDKRQDAFLFANEFGSPLRYDTWRKNHLVTAVRRVADRQGDKLPEGFLEGIDFRAMRRTCATEMAPLSTVKDVQAHLRHASPDITAGVYIQSIPASVRAAVEALDRRLMGGCSAVVVKCELMPQ